MLSLTCLFWSWENGGTESPNDLPMATELVNDRAKVWSYVYATLPFNDNTKPGTCQKSQRKGKQVIQQAKSHIVTAIIKTRQEKQDTKNKIPTPKVCSKTPWGGVLISFESFLKNKEPLQDTVVAENLKVPRSVRRTVLDEDIFSVQLQKSLKILKPISTAITTSESDSALLSDIPYQMGQIESTVLETLSAVPLTSTEKSKGKDY